ncbi:peptidoglycan-binding protein [Streptomyces sp. NPDC088810]|uniref:peptidoglycan-binding protein n=1 Tax=Streptomyces sp. NPDC088810 TaxID=3365904 RepID=UPI003805BAF3
MGRNDGNRERTPASDRDLVQETRDSFQAVLDALDAARADLLREEQQEPVGGPSQSRSRRGHPTGDARSRPHRPSAEPGTVPPPPVGKPPTVNGPSPEPAAPAAAPPDRSYGRKTVHGRRRCAGHRDLRVAAVLGLGAASGLVLATWLLIHHDAETAASPPPSGHTGAPLPASPAPQEPASPAPGQTDRPRPGASNPPLPEIPGTGVLRQGDSGHGVFELQVRLQQIPGIYDGGAIDGRYDAEVRAAVTLFQERYAVHGDESGVYGARTRFALMLRTK